MVVAQREANRSEFDGEISLSMAGAGPCSRGRWPTAEDRGRAVGSAGGVAQAS